MKTILNVIIKTDEDFSVMTKHPLQETINAKQNCDKISEAGGVYTVKTVSPDTSWIYWHYGKFEKGIDVRLFLDERQVELEEVFDSFNKVLDYQYRLLSDEAKDRRNAYYSDLCIVHEHLPQA